MGFIKNFVRFGTFFAHVSTPTTTTTTTTRTTKLILGPLSRARGQQTEVSFLTFSPTLNLAEHALRNAKYCRYSIKASQSPKGPLNVSIKFFQK